VRAAPGGHHQSIRMMEKTLLPAEPPLCTTEQPDRRDDEMMRV
jgi:hypothetical protein